MLPSLFNIMAYNPEALRALNDDFVRAINELLPLEYEAARTWLKRTFEISTNRNVDAWFGKASFSRNYLSANTPAAQKDDRIVFAEAFLGRLQTGRPLICKDFYLAPVGDQLDFEKFQSYFNDHYIKQNIDLIAIDESALTLCYATESDPNLYTHGDFDLTHPMFDEFRSGEEEF